MRNRHVEAARRAAKQYHRDRRGTPFADGIYQHYVLDNELSSLSWRTDAVFILNDYRVLLRWVHPRQAYQELGTAVSRDIRPSWSSTWQRRARVIDLCVPLEVRNTADLRRLVALTRRLLLRETTLALVFPSFTYGPREARAESPPSVPSHQNDYENNDQA